MDATANEPATRRLWLSQALKALRRRRGLRALNAAELMGMPLRSYEYFEAGFGRLDVDRVHRFAAVLEADPYAILTALEIGSPQFAVRCAENKLATIVTKALQAFDTAAGDAIAQLDSETLTAAFQATFASLAGLAQERAALATQWLSTRASSDDHAPQVTKGPATSKPNNG